MSTLSLDLTDELLDAVADRVLARLESRSATPAPTEWLRGAEAIAAHIGATPSRVYALHSAGRIDCVAKDGSALVAKRAELDAWIRAGGGKRP